MSNPVHIQSFLDGKVPMLLVVDEVLNDWNGEGCFQFPALLGQVQLKMGWNDDEEGKKQLRANDPIIREYIRSHPDWYVTRGAHGGIMRASEKQKKEAVAEAKRKAKEEMNAELDAKVAELKAKAAAAIPATDNTNIVTE
jgi:hypothetical protein